VEAQAGGMTIAGTCSVQFGTSERVDWHLWNWARWMRSGQEVQGHARESQGLSSGGTSKGFDEMVETEDRRCAKAVNAILDNLPPTDRIAIYIEQRVMKPVFTFTRKTYQRALSDGKAALGRELNRRGIW
jgi:hypothetical protein